MQTAKEKVRCTIISGSWRIEGFVHVIADSRLTDSLNSRANDFIVCTDAKVYDIESRAMLYKATYVAVNRTAINLVIPVDG